MPSFGVTGMSKDDQSGDHELNRRQLLAGAGGGSAALLLAQNGAQAQTQPGAASGVTVFTHTSVFVTADQMQDDVGLAIAGGKITAMGPSDQILRQYPGADVYDGRGKAILPGLINCHAHLTATIERGFNEDFGFPNTAKLALSPSRLLSDEERTLMAQIGILEAIKCGTTSFVEYASGISGYAGMLADSGLRMIFAEAIADTDNVSGPMSPELLAKSAPPVYSAARREEGMKRISDLRAAWHGKKGGRISVFPTASLAETSSPELLKAVRGFADAHDLGYSIHLQQSIAENDYMKRYHGVTPIGFLDQAGFLGPRLFAAHCRYMEPGDFPLLGKARAMVSHQAPMAADRGADTPVPELRKAGATIVYGSDNNTNDIFEVMRVAMLSERLHRKNDPVPGLHPQPEDVFEDCTIGGARATHQEKALGSLALGKTADLIVLDTQRAHLVPCGRILSAWIHNGQPSDIESVMVDGSFVMRGRKVLTMDEAQVIAEADKVGKRIWGQVKAAGPIPIPGRPRPA
jgi:5-methylthioadenosine/S-adenosylhomocysteine deaminase